MKVNYDVHNSGNYSGKTLAHLIFLGKCDQCLKSVRQTEKVSLDEIISDLNYMKQSNISIFI